MQVAVMGAGSWGTLFAKIMADAGGEIMLYGRRSDITESINKRHENLVYHPGLELPANVVATSDPAHALTGADLVVLAIPSQTLRSNLRDWSKLLTSKSVLVSLMKGIELGTGKRMSEVIREVADMPAERVVVVSGPNLAPEIAEGQPSAAVASCVDEATARIVQRACMTSYYRVYTNNDVIGCELGGAVKNVIALCVGMTAGLGFGDNTRAVLITRGLAEITRLGSALGAAEHTFAGLAGLGDLVATCASPLSRNRTFGESLGRGISLADVIVVTKQTAEGVKSSGAVLELARKHNVEMPITEVVASVIHHGLSIQDATVALMSRAPRPERYA